MRWGVTLQSGGIVVCPRATQMCSSEITFFTSMGAQPPRHLFQPNSTPPVGLNYSVPGRPPPPQFLNSAKPATV